MEIAKTETQKEK